MVYDLSEELSTYVSEQIGRKPAEQFQIAEELALFRHAVGNSVKLYDAARGIPKDNPDRNAKIMAAGELMKESLMQVANLASKAAAIDATVSQKLTVATISYVIESVLNIAIQILQTELPGDLADRIVKLIEDDVEKKIAFDTSRGTALLPGQDVREMDLTLTVEHKEEPEE